MQVPNSPGGLLSHKHLLCSSLKQGAASSRDHQRAEVGRDLSKSAAQPGRNWLRPRLDLLWIGKSQRTGTGQHLSTWLSPWEQRLPHVLVEPHLIPLPPIGFCLPPGPRGRAWLCVLHHLLGGTARLGGGAPQASLLGAGQAQLPQPLLRAKELPPQLGGSSLTLLQLPDIFPALGNPNQATVTGRMHVLDVLVTQPRPLFPVSSSGG